MKEEIDKGLICFGPDETTIPSVRRNLFDKDEQVLRSVIFSYAQKAAQDFANLFDGERIFDNPKNYMDMQQIVSYFTSNDDIVMDFFAGSASFGHGVFEANARDAGNRKFILIQLPEKCAESSVAYDAGFKTIAEIGKERLRRVSMDYKKQRDDKHRIDVGFRAFSLDRSCFKAWDGTLDDIKDKDLIERIVAHGDHVDRSAAPDDVLFELLLKDGFPLTVPLVRLEVVGKEVFSVAGGALLICLDNELTQELMDALAEMEPARVICLDAGFKDNDQLKANAVQAFKARARTKETAIEFRTV